MKRGNYQTKHYDQIINFMKENEDHHITVTELQENMDLNGAHIGTATLYRNLERMVEEGVIMKYTVSPDSPACFQYLHSGSQSEMCYHGKCEVCGKIIHLHCDEVKKIQEHMSEEHHFRVNLRRTVFYGICEECQGKEEL